MDDPQKDAPQSPEDIPRRTSSAVTLWVIVVIAVFWMTLTMCMCGLTSWEFSIGILPLFCLALYVFVVFPRTNIIEQILGAIAFALIVGMLMKNVSDILYFGHEPLLRFSYPL